MIRAGALGALAIGLVASCTAAPPPSPVLAGTAAPTAVATRPPTPTSTPGRGRAVIYVSAPGAPPLAVGDPAGLEGADPSAHVYYRLAHLWAYRGPLPAGYVDPAGTVKARPYRIGIADDLAVVTFVVPPDGWGIDAAGVKLLLQQIVFTVTEEPGIERVRLREEGTITSSDPEEGAPIVIAGTRVPLILTRDLVR